MLIGIEEINADVEYILSWIVKDGSDGHKTCAYINMHINEVVLSSLIV